jgi:hypothetical protein
MSEIDLSDVINDMTLAEEYTIQRLSGLFQLGGWQQTVTTIDGYGVVSVASDEDLLRIPEGDRLTGAMVFHSECEIYITELEGIQRISDQLLWNNQLYRVCHVAPYGPNRNYWKAIAVRMAGQ